MPGSNNSLVIDLDQDETISDKENDEGLNLQDNINTDDQIKEKSKDSGTEELVVYISGGVKEPGVYTLPYGSRVYQLIELAGGELEDSLLELLNLASPLEDGQHIHIYREGDDIDYESQLVPDNKSQGDTKININTADITLLESLPGIGPVRAESIIKHREKVGEFTSIEQIMDVNGIGPGIFNQIKELIVT
ncbi:ComEA family DNA-binding protein [Natranaerobius thermophilus JW/NM-WN-LF]